MANRKLTLWIYEPHDMARLNEGRHELFYGNFWDFHSACCGTKIDFADGTEIDFAKEWTGSGPYFVADMVAKKIGATVEVRHRKTEFL